LGGESDENRISTLIVHLMNLSLAASRTPRTQQLPGESIEVYMINRGQQYMDAHYAMERESSHMMYQSQHIDHGTFATVKGCGDGSSTLPSIACIR